MDLYEKFMKLGKEFDLKGPELLSFVEEKVKSENKIIEKQRKEENERQERLKKEENERQEMIEKLRKEENERQERLKKEENERQERLQKQQWQHEKELELMRLDQIKSHATLDHKMKHEIIKIKYFNPKEESIESYLTLFQTLAEQNNIEKEKWATLLLSKLTGDTLNIIQYMTPEERTDFELVKRNLLTFLGQTEDVYRKKFHDIKLDKSKDPQVLIHEIHTSLIKWIELTKIDLNSPQAILEIFVVDKVLNNASDNLFTFLKERKINNEKMLITALSDFKDAHPNVELDNREHKLTAITNNDREKRYKDKRYFSLPNRGNYTIRCWTCNRLGHTSRKCRSANYNKQHQAFNYNKSPNYKRWHQPQRQQFSSNYQRQQRTQHKESPNVSPEATREDRGRPRKKENTMGAVLNNKGQLSFYPALVNGRKTVCLRDSGCTTVVVKKTLVNDNQYTNNTENIKLGDGKQIECQTAIIKVDTPWIKGQIEAIVMEEPISPLIIGNLPDLVPDISEKILREWLERKDPVFNLILTEENNIKETKEYQVMGAISIATQTEYKHIRIDAEKDTNVPEVNSEENEIQENIYKYDEIKFSKWNGTEDIDKYIHKFCTIMSNVGKSNQEKAQLLRDNMIGNKRGYKISQDNIENYEKMKDELISKLSYKGQMKTNESHELNVMTRAQQKTKVQQQQPTVITETCTSIMNISKEQLIKEQKEDKVLNNYIKRIDSDQNRRQKHQFKLINGILVREMKSASETLTQIMIPETLKQLVLKTTHSSPLAGHMGPRRTIQRITKHCFWPHIRKDVKKYIKSCEECQRLNNIGPKHKAPLQKMDLASRPFEKIAVDIIGPMAVTSKRQNKYALTMIDFASRWIEAIPLKEITAESICHALLSIFTRFGFPEIILSDNGTQFRSQITAAFTHMLNITQTFAARYRPQANGAVERANQSIKTMLRKVVNDKQAEWDRFLPLVLFAYREIPHESTGFSPCELVFGANPKSPLEKFKDELLQKKEISISPYDLVTKTREEIMYAVQYAKKNLENKNSRYRDLVNKNRYLRKLVPKDRVFVFLPQKVGFDKAWQGPYTIIEKCSNVDYIVNINGKNKLFHIDLLRKFDEPPKPLQTVIEEVIDVSKIATMTNQNKIPENSSEIISLMKESEQNDIDIVTIINENEQTEIFGSIENKRDTITEVKLNHIDSEEIRRKLKEILIKHRKTISNKPGHTEIIKHTIELNDKTPFHSKAYVVPQALKSEVDKEIANLLKLGLIETSNSEYSSPMVLVKKKNGGLRLCCDYRKLNKITRLDKEGLPNSEDIINTLGTGKIFSTIDLTRGFWQIPMDEESKKYTAFNTHSGFYQWNVMPFGLVNSTATFTRMMRKILKPHHNIQHYVDDVCVFSQTWQEHLNALEHLFNTLSQHNLTVSPDKLHIGHTEIEFLGHKFTRNGITTTDSFQQKLLHIKRPTTKKHVRGLLGLFNYYSKFIEKYTDLVKPLRELTKKSQPMKIKWNDNCEHSLTKLIQTFQTEPLLGTVQVTDKLVLQTDASKEALGACLFKEELNNLGNVILKPTNYLSRALSQSEKKYSVIELECLAIVWSVIKLQRYLLGREFIIMTDHKPLLNFNISHINNNRINKYAMILADYQFQLKSIKGSDNHIADILSRLSVNIKDHE